MRERHHKTTLYRPADRLYMRTMSVTSTCWPMAPSKPNRAKGRTSAAAPRGSKLGPCEPYATGAQFAYIRSIWLWYDLQSALLGQGTLSLVRCLAVILRLLLAPLWPNRMRCRSTPRRRFCKRQASPPCMRRRLPKANRLSCWSRSPSQQSEPNLGVDGPWHQPWG